MHRKGSWLSGGPTDPGEGADYSPGIPEIGKLHRVCYFARSVVLITAANRVTTVRIHTFILDQVQYLLVCRAIPNWTLIKISSMHH